MARTKEQLVNVIVDNKIEEMLAGASWADLVSAVGDSEQAERDAILASVITKDNAQAGYLLRELLKRSLRAGAVTSVNSLLSDDSLSIAELDLVL